MARRRIHPDGLVAARARAWPGVCTFCFDPVARASSELCASRECQVARNRAYGRDWRLNHPGYQAAKSRAWRKANPLYHPIVNAFKKEGTHART